MVVASVARMVRLSVAKKGQGKVQRMVERMDWSKVVMKVGLMVLKWGQPVVGQKELKMVDL